MKVTIAVPTYKRVAGLPRLVTDMELQIADLKAHLPGWNADLLVVDNDPEGSALAVLSTLSLPWLRCVVEPGAGVVAARNRALNECLTSDLLAFIDDDERPGATWLRALVSTWQETGAAAVAGRVVPVYEEPPDDFIEAGGFFVRRDLPTGTVVPTAPTSNLLLDLCQVREMELTFDERFGLSGGEDTMFTSRLSRGDRLVVFCHESEAEDQVPCQRMTRSWVLARALSHGNTTGLVELALAAGPIGRARLRARLILGGGGRLAIGFGRWGAGTLARSPGKQARGARLSFRGLGMVSAACGLNYHEYERSRRNWFLRFRRLPRGWFDL